MKYFFWLILIITCAFRLKAQEKTYFQQEVNYRIQVRLDDRKHTLHGSLEVDYINHSPDELPFIWFHLWPNAYRDQTTAFAQQQRLSGSTEFYFAKDNQLGYVDSLQFSADDSPCRLEYDPDHPDIARVWLPQPLPPGAQVTIRTPFFVKIPDSFSRLGHVGESYQITQWYPKPAVYDREGWHPMPYLDRGEFYSELGSFDVAITLPANYIVGATGTLQTESEMAFLKQKAEETNAYLAQLPTALNEGFIAEPFPDSDQEYKTIRYTAEKVHDFAWFADKRFKVLHDTIELTNDQVDAWSFFTRTEEQLWRKSIDYLRRSVIFYSSLIGDYPYSQVSAVQSALSAGGGMEYPMITVIDLAGSDRSLDEVITHEVGHNWFYGILASNERDHPWMDEGVNSFYEQRYMHEYYPPKRPQIIPAWLADDSLIDADELLYQLQARQGLDQAPDTPSEQFSELNYWLSAYDKPARGLWWLFHWLGPELFDKAMQTYYSEWQFRHPQPADMQRSLEKVTGRDLNWFFQGFIRATQQADYAIKELRKEGDKWLLTVENRGNLPGPVPVWLLRDGDVLPYEQWIDGFTGQQTVELPSEDFDQVALDAGHFTLDVNRKNNQIKTNGLFRKLGPFRMAIPAKMENEKYTSLYWMPLPGWNVYDGLQAGLLLHNRTLPFRQLEFDLLPLYGFRSGSLNGIGNIDYHFYPKQGLLQAVELGVNYRQFHFERQSQGVYDLRYQRWQPWLGLHLRTAKGSTFRHQLGYRMIYLETERPNIGREDGFIGVGTDFSTIHEWHYAGENRRKLNPFHYRLALEQQSYDDVFERAQQYLKWSVEWKSKLAYAENKEVSARLFAGGFFSNTRRNGGAIFPGAFSLIDQAAMDYRYDDFYFGRSEREGLWSQQIGQRDGGFKVPLNPAFNLGKSNNFLLAVNLKVDLPFGNGWPIRPYLDLGYFDNAMPTGADDTFSDQFLWSGGLALEILDGRLGIYFPCINSKNLQDRLLEQGGYGKRIGFRVDLYGEKIRNMWPY
ncbi:MAG: M1 family metallopeptidase [Saprospiraceae bacterium]|nr:M1 family metallopeptidase [Lewinella sp.]